jgi:hypothetical protein
MPLLSYSLSSSLRVMPDTTRGLVIPEILHLCQCFAPLNSARFLSEVMRQIKSTQTDSTNAAYIRTRRRGQRLCRGVAFPVRPRSSASSDPHFANPVSPAPLYEVACALPTIVDLAGSALRQCCFACAALRSCVCASDDRRRRRSAVCTSSCRRSTRLHLRPFPSLR